MEINKEKTVCFTAHRPHLLYGYNKKTSGNQKIIRGLYNEIVRHIKEYGIDTFISGMALGGDTWAAEIVLKLKSEYPNIKLVCAIPCFRQEIKWKEYDRMFYHAILDRSDYVHYVSKKEYTKKCMWNRDKWMVNNSKYVIAVYNGEPWTGTGLTYNYAVKKNRIITRIDPYKLGGFFNGYKNY